MDVLLAQAVFVAVLDEALGGVDHEDALAGGGVLLVEHDDAGRDAGAVKEVGGQADDALEVAARTSCWRMAASALPRKSTPCGRMTGAFARALDRADDVQEVGVIALLRRRHRPSAKRWKASFVGMRPVLQVLSENGGLATT